MKSGVFVGVWLGLMGCVDPDAHVGVLCVEETPARLVEMSVVDVCADLEPQEFVSGWSIDGRPQVEDNGVPHTFRDFAMRVTTSRRVVGCGRDVLGIGSPLNDQFGFHHWTNGESQRLDFFVDEEGKLRDPQGRHRLRMCAEPGFVPEHSGLLETGLGDTAEPPMDSGAMDTGDQPAQ